MVDAFKNAFAENPVKIEIPTDDKPEAQTAPEQEAAKPEESAETSSAQEEKTEVKAEEAEKPEPSRDEGGKFTKTVPHEALHAERKRREAAEARLAALEQEQRKPPTSVHEDEDKAFNERLSEATRPIAQRLLNLSISAAKRQHEDYQEVYDFMDSEVLAHPELMQAINNADDPGEYIYQLGKTRKELAAVGGDFTKLREQAVSSERDKRVKIEAENKALKAELDALKASKEKRDQIPQSLNAEQSSAVKGDSFAGPTPLKNVFSS